MKRLNESRLAEFLSEIASAIAADVPLAESMIRLKSSRSGWLPRAASQFHKELEKGKKPASVVGSLHQRFGPAASSAMEMAQATGRPSALNQLAQQLKLRNQLRRESAIAWVYPILLIWIACGLFCLPLAPLSWLDPNAAGTLEIESFPERSQWGLATLQTVGWWMSVCVSVVTMVVVARRLLSPQTLPVSVRRELFCRSLADQIECGLNDQTALRIAATLSDDRAFLSRPAESIDDPRIRFLIAEAGLPDSSISRQEQLVATFRTLASYYQQVGRQRSFFWIRIFPRLVTAVVGGGYVLAYALWVLGPIYEGLAL